MAGASAAVALWGYAFASLLVVISQIIFLRQAEYYPSMLLKRNAEKGFQYIRTMRNYARPFLIMGGFTWFLSFADRWALSLFCPMSEVGYYAALYQVGYFPMIFASRILMQLVSPVLYERAGGTNCDGPADGLNRFNKRLTFFVLGLSIALWVVLHQIHKPLFALFVDQNYQGVSYLLPWTVLSAGIYSAGSIPLVSVLSRFESGRILPMKIVTTLLGVICYITGAFFYKLEGLVFGGLVFSFIYLICASKLNVK
jgi:O-antigen/teichoic acid export membrane protein